MQLKIVAAALVISTASGCSGGTDLIGTNQNAHYHIYVPAHWNGTLLVYSHGYIGEPLSPALEEKFDRAGLGTDADTVAELEGEGYALAASLFDTGWSVQAGLVDQTALLDFFESEFGRPRRVIAWGASMGGLVSVGLAELHSDRIDGAVPLCGVLSGGVATWNFALDAEFVVKTLLAPTSNLELVDITDPATDAATLSQIIATAQSTPQGRARLAFAAALADAPGWPEGAATEPSSNDVQTRATSEIAALVKAIPLLTAGRADLETRVGGNPSSNVGIDYGVLLQRSTNFSDVQTLYAQAGLTLDADLATLTQAGRFAADSAAAMNLDASYSPNGKLAIPVLTLHTVADDEAPVANEGTYATTVASAGKSDSLRQLFIHREGHCNFTSAEVIAAVHAMTRRLDAGQWPDLAIAVLNRSTASLASELPPSSAPAFDQFLPPELPRQ